VHVYVCVCIEDCRAFSLESGLYFFVLYECIYCVYVNVILYICMYVCMCAYVRIHVCTHGHICACMLRIYASFVVFGIQAQILFKAKTQVRVKMQTGRIYFLGPP
jgi:hypothetical protein